MAVPKNFRTNLNIIPTKIGPDRRQEILDGIADKGTFLPRGVSEEDMDETFVEFVNNDLSISVDGTKVPVLFLTIQRWSEFSKTWTFTDQYKDIQVPFITVVRQPDVQQGQNQAGLWNIPGNRTYTYMKVPTWDGIRKGTDLYKVPQPTPVDLTYEVRIFTNRMRDLNKFNSLIMRKFQSKQYYITPKGHPMPVHLEGVSDESNIDDFENRRFYVQQFEMKLLGYILDEDDFEVVPTINRTYVFLELDEGKTLQNVIFDPVVRGNVVNYTIVFKPRSEQKFTFMAKYNLVFNQLVNIENISNIIILVNNVEVFNGLSLTSSIILSAGDQVDIKITKNNLVIGKFQLLGNTL